MYLFSFPKGFGNRNYAAPHTGLWKL